MNGLLLHLNTHDQLWESTSWVDSGVVNVTEIIQDSTTGARHTVHDTVSNENLDAWLSERKDVRQEGLSSFCIFRIVWVERNILECESYIEKSSLNCIVEAFGLQLSYEYYSTAFSGIALLPSRNLDQGIHCFSFCFHPKVAIIWAHNKHLNLTQAICFTTSPVMRDLKNLLDRDWMLFSQAILIPFLCAIMLSVDVDKVQRRTKQKIREVEVRTGHHRWSHRREPPAAGDLSSLSEEMGGCATKIASVARKTRVAEELTEFVVGYLQKECVEFTVEEKMLRDNLSLIKDRSRMQHIDTVFIQQRIKVQLNAVSCHGQSLPKPGSCERIRNTHRFFNDQLFHIIAQNEARTSNEAAWHSKVVATASLHDSTSMQTVAIVTMFFLPPTFVATLFAMPIIHWNVPQTPLDENFGIFFAVTVPLTMITFLCWIVGTRKRSHKLNKEIDDMKAEFGNI
ncbi:hypothetical protein EIK77_003982 [Talaromyces pinophilus]|nr:hypothetical protein EIK77_003982 [Talaromyces pinophilus]